VNKTISIKWVMVIVVLSLIIGHFAGGLLKDQINLNYFNTLEVTGNMVIGKAVLEKNHIQIKLVSALRIPDPEVSPNAPVLGVRANVKAGDIVTIVISDEYLKYAKNGTLVDMICKEGEKEFFACKYAVEPKALCPVPAPTPKPTPKPKVKK
jgi:hypothetical protein